jgi:flagellar motility protein MotE (MotC chaperone)
VNSKALAYAITFIFTFFLVTGVLMHLNNFYSNIWKFDFTVKENKPEPEDIAKNVNNLDYNKIEKLIQKQLKNGLVDTLKNVTGKPRVDTVYTKMVMDNKLLDSLSVLQKQIAQTVQQNQAIVEKKEALSKKELDAENEKYLTWTKKTAKLYENMDAGKAAKIITKYSDNVARDILYKMKQRKAAEILALLNPEVANRITREE